MWIDCSGQSIFHVLKCIRSFQNSVQIIGKVWNSRVESFLSHFQLAEWAQNQMVPKRFHLPIHLYIAFTNGSSSLRARVIHWVVPTFQPWLVSVLSNLQCTEVILMIFVELYRSYAQLRKKVYTLINDPLRYDLIDRPGVLGNWSILISCLLPSAYSANLKVYTFFWSWV